MNRVTGSVAAVAAFTFGSLNLEMAGAMMGTPELGSQIAGASGDSLSECDADRGIVVTRDSAGNEVTTYAGTNEKCEVTAVIPDTTTSIQTTENTSRTQRETQDDNDGRLLTGLALGIAGGGLAVSAGLRRRRRDNLDA